MKKLIRFFVTITLAVAMAVGITGCSIGTNTSDVVRLLVQGNLDTTYLGKFDKDYMELTDSSEEDLQNSYESCLDVEAEYFCSYFLIVDSDRDETYDNIVSDETKEKIRDLYKEIYSHSKYTVGEPVKNDDDSFTVPVTISPINIMELVVDAVNAGDDNPFMEFQNQDHTDELNTDEGYYQYTQDYAQACIDLVESQMDNIGYDDDKVVNVKVSKNSDDLYEMDHDDFSEVDEYIIMYP